MKTYDLDRFSQLAPGVLVAVLLGLAGCAGPGDPIVDDDDDSVGDDDDDDDATSGTVQGRISDDGARDLDGYVVTVFQVQANGSLEQVSEGEATTDAEGRYSVSVGFSSTSEVMTDLIVMAESEIEGEGSAIVSGELSSDGTVTAAPIDSETSAEADVFVSIAASGSWDGEAMSGSLVRLMIDARTATEIAESTDAEAEIDVVAQATASAMLAWSEMLESSANAGTSTTADLALEAMAEAQTELDAALDAAADASAEAQAWAEFAAALEAGFEDVGIDSSSSLMATVAADEASNLSLMGDGEADSDAQLALQGSLALQRADAMAQAATSLGSSLSLSSEARGALESANAELRSSIDAAIEAGLESSADFAAESEQAFDSWRVQVMGSVMASLDAAQQTAAGVAVDIAADAQAELDAELDGDASSEIESNVQLVVTSMADYLAGINGAGLESGLTAEGMSSAEAGSLIDGMGGLFSSGSVDLDFVLGAVFDLQGNAVTDGVLEVMAVSSTGVMTSLSRAPRPSTTRVSATRS